MKRYIFLSLIAIGYTFAQAQNRADSTLTQSLTLEREFSPIIQGANKVDRQPEIEEVSVKRTTPTYTGINAAPVSPTQIGIMAAGQVLAEQEPEQSGYLDFSAGNYWNSLLDAGYKMGELSFKADGYFTNGYTKAPFYRPTYENGVANASRPNWEGNLFSGRLTANWTHSLDNEAELSAYLTAGGVSARTFNFATIYNTPTSPGDPTYVDCGDLIYEDKFETKRQAFGQFKAGIAYEAEAWDVELEYDHTGLKYPDISDNALGLNASYCFSNNAQWITLASLHTDLTFTDEKNYFAIKPTVEVSYLPDELSLRRIYAKLGVGTNRPGLYSIMERCPLTYPIASEGQELYKTPFDLYDFTLGWEDSENGAFVYGLSANAYQTRNQLCGIMTFVPSSVAEATPYQLGSFQKLVNTTCFNLDVEAHARYEYNRYFAMSLNAVYYYQDNHLAAMCEPTFRGIVHLLSNPDRFKFDLSFRTELDRQMAGQFYAPRNMMGTRTYVIDEVEDFDLDPIYDLGFRADYQYSKTLSFYLYGCNLLNRSWQLWPGIPAQRINIHAGFNWKF